MEQVMLSPKKSKHLVHAARYLEAVHDIKIDEKHPKLHNLIQAQLKKVNSKQLDKYWSKYLEADSIASSELTQQGQSSEDNEEEYIYYRGIKMLKP